jgi:hypothetical protein
VRAQGTAHRAQHTEISWRCEQNCRFLDCARNDNSYFYRKLNSRSLAALSPKRRAMCAVLCPTMDA